MTKITSCVLAITLATGLSGCQSLFGQSGFGSSTARADLAPIDMSDYFAQRIEAGKVHLRNNRPTQAIAAFRQASYDPAYAAEAYNGMAVSYAQIGRADLAKRFFGMAVAAAPQDERFARNLARIEGQAAADEIQLASAADDTADALIAAERAAPQPVQFAPPAPMVRVSDREVHIAPRTDAKAEVRVGPVAQDEVLLAARDYPIRVELPTARTAPRAQYPVRIALSDVQSSSVPYPIRIELPKAR
jgi:tetratricopeptide (TPR) repeat protein